MARPKKAGLDYFPHDCNSSSDERLEIFEAKYPNGLGYAWYFKTLERIYRNGGEIVSSAETIAEIPQILGRNLQVNPEEILFYALKIGLFDKNEYETNNKLTSDGIKKRMKPILDRRDKMAKSYEKRVSSAETMQKSAETVAETPQRKGKESKGKESKEKERKEESQIPQSLMTNEFIQSWNLWKKFRGEIKKPLVPTTINQQLQKLEVMGPEKAVEALKQSMANGWQGIFEPRQELITKPKIKNEAPPITKAGDW
jgi:hypothetical protein